MNLLDQFAHLAARFFTSLSPAPPAAELEAWVEEQLLESERLLWKRMDNRDRRHCAYVAKRFSELRADATRAEIAGACLHDVGKIECGLGTFARVAATIIGPHGRRFRSYHDHEAIGADLASDAGSDPATVELIAGHGPAFADLQACDHA